MSLKILLTILKDKLLSRTILVALIADVLLLLPFFFTSNLFSKILPSGNTSSLLILLVFSLLAQQLSKEYDRLRTAGLLKIQRRVLSVLSPQEGVLLFARGKDLTPNIRLLQSIFVMMRSGDFIAIAGAALQVFFPISVLLLIAFVSLKLFFVVLIFLIVYGLIFQSVTQSNNQSGQDQETRMTKIRNSWFYRWMGAATRRDLFFIQGSRYKAHSPWSGAIAAANLASFRYSSSLLLLALCAFFIISESLPTGYLLPISFFSQRLLMPAERLRQVSLIYRIFTFAAVNLPKSYEEVVSTKQGVDHLKFSVPVKIIKEKSALILSEAFEVKSGEMLAVSGSAGLGKTAMLEAILGMQPIQEGRIDLVTRHKHPWDLVRYLNQRDLTANQLDDSFYLSRLINLEKVLASPKAQLIVLDDPVMGMDGLAKGQAIELIRAAKSEGALLVVSTNDRQLVAMSNFWLSIQEDGAIQLRKIEGAA